MKPQHTHNQLFHTAAKKKKTNTDIIELTNYSTTGPRTRVKD